MKVKVVTYRSARKMEKGVGRMLSAGWVLAEQSSYFVRNTIAQPSLRPGTKLVCTFTRS